MFLVVFAASILVLGSSGAVLAQFQDVEDDVSRISLAPLPINNDGDDDDGLGIGKKVAGSYLVDADLAPGVFPPGQGLQTLTITGELVSTDNGALAGLSPTTPQQGPFLVPIFGPGHGAWKRTGPYEITNTALIQGHFGVCPAPATDCDPSLIGQQVSTCKPTAVVQFDEDYQTATGSLTTVCFFAGVDPLDPASVPFFDSEAFFGPGTIEYKRIGLGN